MISFHFRIAEPSTFRPPRCPAALTLRGPQPSPSN